MFTSKIVHCFASNKFGSNWSWELPQISRVLTRQHGRSQLITNLINLNQQCYSLYGWNY